MPTDTALRQRVADLIRESNRTQADLAAASGVGQSTIASIVSGTRSDLRAAVVARLGRALRLSPAALGRILYDCHPEKTSENNPERD